MNGKASILCFSETKLDNSITDSEIEIEDYLVVRRDRNVNGGGVCMYIHKDTNFKNRTDLHHENIESVWVEILFDNAKSVIVGTIYRPPEQSDFYDTLDGCLADVGDVETIIIGDWNTDMQRKDTSVFKSFSRICDLHGFSQLITQPTRVCETTQTTIDLILTSDRSRISSKGVIACGLSDHYMIFCTRKKLKQKAGCHKTVISRDLKNYSSEAFNLELESLDWSDELSGTQVEETWLGFKNKFSAILNDLAPLRTTRVKKSH